MHRQQKNNKKKRMISLLMGLRFVWIGQNRERVNRLQENGKPFESADGEQLKHRSQQSQKCLHCISSQF